MSPRDRFLKLLREDVLQLDLADLDFGIYRLLNHRRQQIDGFLAHELPAHIDAELARLSGRATEDEQARIFNALYTFFNRYYDEGDFMPRARRGREAAYSVPYNGEDVHFHWATKGSHYVKSGERFSGYAYTDGARRVTLGLRRADTEKDNIKGARRCYVPAEFSATDGGAALRFDYRPLEAAEARRYESRKKAAGNADAEDAHADEAGHGAPEGKSAQDRLLNAWLAGKDFTAVAVPAGLDRELLRKHVPRYVKGQTADFFVHPRLGAFLRGELDYFLKNEFVSVWDLPDDALPRERGKHRIVKQLAERIIDVLAAIEDVQAILFEKRKFVIGCDWLIRASALATRPGGPALLEQVCANAAQVAEWARWVGEKAPEGDVAAAGRNLLARFPHLPVHTRHFDAEAKFRLLSAIEDLSQLAGGDLIHAENFAALRTIERAHNRYADCIYIDPPYNTAGSEIAYKNGFRGSSWITLIESRVRAGRRLLKADGAFVCAIDDFEVTHLSALLDDEFGTECHWATVPVRSKPQGRATANGFSANHEYLLFYGQGESSVVGRLPREGTRAARYPENDKDGAFAWANLRKTGSDSRKSDRPGQFYPFFVGDGKALVPEMEWDEDAEVWIAPEPPAGTAVVLPIDDSGEERVWTVAPGRASKDLSTGEIELRIDGTGRPSLVRKYRPNEEGALPHTWWADPKYSASESGTKVLRDVFGKRQNFSFPKSVAAVADALRVLRLSATGLSLDFFAGSGTTGHAVINLNREDGGSRRFTLIEQGEYFDTVLLPRIAKVITCPEWKDGKPKPGVSMQPAAGEDPATHWSARSPELVKILRLERYEDALDALELPAEAEARAAGQESLGLDREVIRYLVASVAQGTTVRLATGKLATPFDYRLPCTQAGQHTTVAVDLVETAHLLLGLHPVRMRRLTDAPTGVAVIEEVRPHGAAADVRELVFWRTVDESLAGAALEQRMEAERDWLAAAVRREFGRALTDYRRVRHNRDALLPPGVSGESIDAALAQAMLERA
jgi:adenine-specific DNA-methyltransferase